jgi:hypothetical protein
VNGIRDWALLKGDKKSPEEQEAKKRTMKYSKGTAHPDFEFDDEIPQAKIHWHGSTVEVKSRLVPIYFWTTASIDVFLDGRCILRSGGQKKVSGSSSAHFDHGGSTHVVELSWEKAHGIEFPYILRIDDAKVAVSGVLVENAWLIAMPWLFTILMILIGLYVWTP